MGDTIMSTEKTKEIAVITGADRGCGLALTRNFLEAGWRVYAGQFMPDWPDLDALTGEYPEDLVLIPLDVSSGESVSGAAALISAREEKVDLLVNVAGIAPHGSDDAAALRSTFGVNVFGPLRMTEALLPLLRKGKKRICTFSSEAGCIASQHRADTFAYTMSKTALNMETRLIFNVLREEGFTFRLYHPGWVKSYMSGKKSSQGVFEPEETSIVAFRQFTEDRNYEDVLVLRDVNEEIWAF